MPMFGGTPSSSMTGYKLATMRQSRKARPFGFAVNVMWVILGRSATMMVVWISKSETWIRRSSAIRPMISYASASPWQPLRERLTFRA